FVWVVVDYTSGHEYQFQLAPIWNTFVRLGFYVFIAYLLLEIKSHLKREKFQAKIDGLTGILNPRAFREMSASILELASRHKHSLTLGYIDVDDFKKINDDFGHSEGDRVLKSIASTLTRCARTSDIVARLGGDEFAVLLPETNIDGAKLMFDRIQKELRICAHKEKWRVGFSIGIAIFKNAPLTIEDVLDSADQLMYQVKKSGKDNIHYQELDSPITVEPLLKRRSEERR